MMFSTPPTSCRERGRGAGGETDVAYAPALRTVRPSPNTRQKHVASSIGASSMTTTTNDPWAAAQVTPPHPAGQEQVRSEPVNRAADEAALNPNADPFATESTTGVGGGIRGPQWPDLLDRLVVLRPVPKLL